MPNHHLFALPFQIMTNTNAAKGRKIKFSRVFLRSCSTAIRDPTVAYKKGSWYLAAIPSFPRFDGAFEKENLLIALQVTDDLLV